MKPANLVLALPHGTCTATTLGLEGFAVHRSPGSGRFFQGRAIYVDLKLEDMKPAFEFHHEGGWRDANKDAEAALLDLGKSRTKTALSNNAFSAIPIQGYRSISVAKTGGQILQLEGPEETARFNTHECRAEMSSNEVAVAAGLPKQAERRPRCYLVLGPIELVLLSNLTPEEYAWYATHRPGKVFRQVIFAEINPNPRHYMAEQIFESAKAELERDPLKKTKTIYFASALDKTPMRSWIGYGDSQRGGVYAGDRSRVLLWKFPAKIPSAWDRADG